MIKRTYDDLQKYLKPGKVLMIYGARQVGKTTLINTFLSKTKLKYRLDTGDNLRIQTLFNSMDYERIIEYADGYELIVIDEAQEIREIGRSLKIIVDRFPSIRIIATGSSSFHLSQKTGEPLTGRKITKILYPISQSELRLQFNIYDLRNQLDNYLIFGCYPEIVMEDSRESKIMLVSELVDSYLLKDLLSHEKIKSPKVLVQLLKLLAFQIGSEVSLNELSKKLGIDVKTIARYIDLLEKSFVIKSLNGFSRNLRKEVTAKSKYYFIDLGIRNGLISQFNRIEDRNDVGALFENFCIIERLKKQTYDNFYGNHYFWRTYDKKELDLIEEQDAKLNAFKFKYSSRKTPKAPRDWTTSYPDSSYNIVYKENYLEFLL